ncbi:hypothetical protein [Vreelandella profundi]|uniref:hypothetical protein n=1 Tax=Vreelandella profundi TaxID=2852117 RepID=UPI001F369CFD|nr:hypothetical protein [Halomonas profundi]
MSVRSLGSLTLDMVLKTGNFLGPMDKAGRSTKRQTKQMSDDFKKVAKSVTAMGTAAAAAAAGGIALLTREGMNAIDSQAKLARSLGGTIDGLRALNIAASDSGIDGVEASLNRMNRRLGAVEMSGGPALKTVERLNLNLAEMAEMDVDEKLAYIADRIKDSGVSSQEAARHVQQLGFEQRGATELFMKGGDAIRAARQEVDDYGLSVSMVDAAAIEAANDALSRSGRLVESTRNALAVELAPVILEVANQFNNAAREAGGMQSAVQQGVDTSVLYLGTFLDAVWDIDRMIQVAGVSTREFGLTVVRSMATAAIAIIEGPVNAINRFIETINRVPGIDIDYVNQPDFVYGMRDQVDALEGAIKNARAELDELAAGSAPSERLNEFIAQARAAADELKANVGTPDSGGVGLPPPDDGSSAKAAAKAADAIKQQITALEQQAATLGMTQEAVQLFELAQEGATETQLASARAALDTISSFEESEKAAEDYRKLLDDLRTTEEKLTDQLSERLAVLDAVNVASDEYAETAARIAEAAFVDAPDYGGLDASIGGPFGELDKIDDAQEKLQEWYDTQLEMLDDFRAERSDLTAQWDEQERALHEEHQNELTRIEQARQIAQMAAAESTFGDMAGLARAFAGEQSGIYRALFATEKAFAIGKALMAVPSSYSKAFDAVVGIPYVGPALAPAAGAAAAAIQVGQAAAIGNIGMAHDGWDSLPATGSYYLEKGERVSTAETSAKMDNTLAQTDAALARVESQMNRPGASAGGAGAAPTINIIEDKRRSGTTSQRQEGDGRWVIDVVVANISSDGQIDKTMRGKYGVQPRGR